MSADRPNAFLRLYRGETAFDFAGRWRRWFMLSGAVILIGLIALGVRGLNFSIDFRGGTSWEVPTQHATCPGPRTSSSWCVSEVQNAVAKIDPTLAQATVQVITDTQTHKRNIIVEATAKATGASRDVSAVADELAKLAHVSPNEVIINAVGPSWGAAITGRAVRAVIVFLIVISIYIYFRFEPKMAIAALTALLHDIVVTVGIYALSGFQVSPDTVIAFLTILGYSLYDTIVVFDKVQENTKGLAATNRLTYTDTVNISMNQVLARSINTSTVAIIPILSILVIGAWVLGDTSLNDFGLALFIGMTTGAYSSLFIASPLLALLKEREPRYAQIRQRLANRGGTGFHLTPAAVAAGVFTTAEDGATSRTGSGRGSNGPGRAKRAPATSRPATVVAEPSNGGTAAERSNGGTAASTTAPPAGAPDAPEEEPVLPASRGASDNRQGRTGTGALSAPIPPRSNRPPPRPRKKTRRR